MTTQRAAMGTRGQFTGGGPGDLCARRAAAQADVRERYERAIKATKDAIQNEPIEVVSIPGGRSFAVPAEVVRHLLRVGAEEAE
jgi:hypothetical protein